MFTKFVSTGIVGLGLWAGALNPAVAGQYSQNFDAAAFGSTNFADGSVLFSTNLGASVGVYGVNKELQLSGRTTLNTRSAFLLPDLDAGQPVYAFTAQWDSLVQGYFLDGLGGEGFSLNFGPLAGLNLSGGNFNQEDGYGTGLSVGVRTQNTNAPGFYLRVNGVVVSSVANSPVGLWGDNVPSNHLFQVDWNASRGLSLRVDGALIFNNVPTPGFTPQSGDRLAWGQRTTSHAEFFRLDNIVVNTGSQLGVGVPGLTNSTAAPNILSQIAFAASVDPRGLNTTVVIEVGTNTSYGTSVTNFIAANTNGSAAFTGFVPVAFNRVTPLHGRITVSNAAGTTTSGDLALNSTSFALQIGYGVTPAGLIRVCSAAVWLDADDDGALDLAVNGRDQAGDPAGYILMNPLVSTNYWSPRPGKLNFRSCVMAGDFDNDNLADSLWGGRFRHIP